MSTYVFDLDGTLSDPSHRLRYIQGEKKDWTAFYDAAKDDPPIMPVVDVARALYADGHSLYIVTGRNDRVRRETSQWLSRYLVAPPSLRLYLWMRLNLDHRPDHVIKRQWYEEIGQDLDIRMVFEDRSRVVQMWRELGIPVAQVAEGDF